MKIEQKYEKLYTRNEILFHFNEDLYLRKFPPFKGSGINFVMFAEDVWIFLVHSRMLCYTHIICLVLKLPGFGVITGTFVSTKTSERSIVFHPTTWHWIFFVEGVQHKENKTLNFLRNIIRSVLPVFQIADLNHIIVLLAMPKRCSPQYPAYCYQRRAASPSTAT